MRLLPYGLIVRLDNGGDYKTRDLKVKGLSESNDLSGINSIICYLDNELVKFNIKEARPYLRSMSSMTEEETDEYWDNVNLKCPEMPIGEIPSIENIGKCSTIVLNWLLENHFDFMDLIPKNLAIEVTENNNPYK